MGKGAGRENLERRLDRVSLGGGGGGHWDSPQKFVGSIIIDLISVAPIWVFTDIPIVRYIQADIGRY